MGSSRKKRLPRSLRDAGKEFLQYRSPRVLLSGLALALVYRVIVGDYSWWDLVPFAVVLAAEPFIEWTVHTAVLHAKPVQVKGRTFDTVVAVDHRAHHADPRDLPLIFIPFRWVLYLVATLLLIGLAIPDAGLRASWYVAAFGMACLYEWTHFLIHTDYKPRHQPYRHLYERHRLHHYRNEQYWFGITNTLGDTVLGTAPAKEDVPVSPTAKNLHGGVPSAASATAER